jgi:Uma2 family endonuclease
VRLLADDAGRIVPRLTYDQGVLELVTPSMPHDESARTLSNFVVIASGPLGIPIRDVGSTTFRRDDLERAFEADGSFYIQHVPQLRNKRKVDLSTDPPPDLVIEMEFSRSALDKLRLFASMGIPEVWRCDGERVTFFLRGGDSYEESSYSKALPPLTSQVLTQFLQSSRTMLSTEWQKAIYAWAHAPESESEES